MSEYTQRGKTVGRDSCRLERDELSSGMKEEVADVPFFCGKKDTRKGRKVQREVKERIRGWMIFL